MSRAAIFSFGAALAAATGCSSSHDPDEDAGTEEDAGSIDDAGSTDEDAGYDAGNIAPPYGAPPEDAGFAPLYGGAPDED